VHAESILATVSRGGDGDEQVLWGNWRGLDPLGAVVQRIPGPAVFGWPAHVKEELIRG
jgi:hypothetical protein